jgi:hypothetical protein
LGLLHLAICPDGVILPGVVVLRVEAGFGVISDIGTSAARQPRTYIGLRQLPDLLAISAARYGRTCRLCFVNLSVG